MRFVQKCYITGYKRFFPATLVVKLYQKCTIKQMRLYFTSKLCKLQTDRKKMLWVCSFPFLIACGWHRIANGNQGEANRERERNNYQIENTTTTTKQSKYRVEKNAIQKKKKKIEIFDLLAFPAWLVGFYSISARFKITGYL